MLYFKSNENILKYSNIDRALDKFVPRLSIFRSRTLYAFLVSPRQKPSSRRLNTLEQKQYLVREVGENCLIQV